MLVTRAQRRTLERVARRPGVLETHVTGLGFDVAGCCEAGLVERRGSRPGAPAALHLTPRGRAALSRRVGPPAVD